MKIKVNNIEYDVEKLSNGKWSLPKNYENGDKTITVSALNIDGNRCETTDDLAKEWNRKQSSSMVGGTNAFGKGLQDIDLNSYAQTGRYPAQTFIDSKVAEILDRQSGVSKGSSNIRTNSGKDNNCYGDYEKVESQNDGWGDIGGCSKILHKCDYTDEDYDLYNYEPKVSSSERNAGCDGFDEKIGGIKNEAGRGWSETDPMRVLTMRNNHPTLKPIALNEKILKLFKTPNDQKICYPFAGAGSEIIGGIKAGFDNWIGCEISQEYVDIANARIKYWKEEMTTQTSIFDFID